MRNITTQMAMILSLERCHRAALLLAGPFLDGRAIDPAPIPRWVIPLPLVRPHASVRPFPSLKLMGPFSAGEDKEGLSVRANSDPDAGTMRAPTGPPGR